MQMLDRPQLEAREQRDLAPYACHGVDSRGRRYPEAEHPYRSPYMRDRDRIIHATAFRRLEYKTQVFVNHEGDYYRTRLTHTMEVAQIARILARMLGANEDLTEAVALAHDLGHTPFGHSGEQALDELMRPDGGFEHNRHGLRVVEVLEHRYPDFPGLNLTWEVREGIVKHKTTHDNPATEPEFDPDKLPGIESQIVDVADAVAYNSHDVDDGLKSGLLRARDLEGVELWERAVGTAHERYGRLPEDVLQVQAVRFLIDLEVSDVLAETERALAGLRPASAAEVRAAGARVVRFSPRMEAAHKELQDRLMDRLYRHHRVVRMSKKARRFVEAIFAAYVEDPCQLPPEYQKRISQAVPKAEADAPARARATRQVVCDYVAGMTDRFAQDEYLKLFMPYERV